MRQPSTNIAGTCLAALAVLGACSVDLGKLQPPLHKDAAGSTDLALTPGDAAGPKQEAAAPLDDLGETGDQTGGADAPGGGGLDGGPTVAVDALVPTDGLGSDDAGGAVGGAGGGAGTDGSGGTGGGAGSNADSGESSDAGGSGGLRPDGGAEVAADSVGGDDTAVDGAVDATNDADYSGPETTGSATDSGATDGYDGGGAAEVLGGGGPEIADGRAGTDETGGTDVADSRGAGDAGNDAPPVDLRGKVTCPTTINGSLDESDATQIGRHSRYAPASTCGTIKSFPGNGADTTYLHLYDAYHFINPTGTASCFNFTLTYSGTQPLYAAVYSAFDPTNIVTGYLGDVGGALFSPQTMGIIVGAGATIDVVVYATAMGTSAAGSYTLSCSTE